MKRGITCSAALAVFIALFLTATTFFSGVEMSSEESGTYWREAFFSRDFEDKPLYTPPSTVTNIKLIGRQNLGVGCDPMNVSAQFPGSFNTYPSGMVELQVTGSTMVQIYPNSEVIIYIHDSSGVSASEMYGFLNQSMPANGFRTAVENSGEFDAGQVDSITDIMGHYEWYSHDGGSWSSMYVGSSYQSFTGSFNLDTAPTEIYGEGGILLNNQTWDSATLTAGQNNISGGIGQLYLTLDSDISDLMLQNLSVGGSLYGNVLGVFAMGSVSWFNTNKAGELDSDGDGYRDSEEGDAGTDPYNGGDAPRDTDGDGTLDYQDNDDDGDGFTDDEEITAGSDPKDPMSVPIQDTDGDGMTDDIDDDDDDDGYLDWEEDEAGSDPKDPKSVPPDSDGDGLPDFREDQEGTDPYEPDSDGDGYSDKDEIDAMTDPLDPGSKPGGDGEDGGDGGEGTALGPFQTSDGVPIGGADITVDDGEGGNYQGMTDGDGGVYFEQPLPPGNYNLVVEKNGEKLMDDINLYIDEGGFIQYDENDQPPPSSYSEDDVPGGASDGSDGYDGEDGTDGEDGEDGKDGEDGEEGGVDVMGEIFGNNSGPLGALGGPEQAMTYCSVCWLIVIIYFILLLGFTMGIFKRMGNMQKKLDSLMERREREKVPPVPEESKNTEPEEPKKDGKEED